MIFPISAGQVFSILGNKDSLVPMGIKDVSNSIGLTVGSYITGKKTEGEDKFIDEFGTQGIWLLGIPFFKMIINSSFFKLLGLDHKVDVRVLKDKKVFELAKKYAKQHDELYKDNKNVEKYSKSFEKITKNQNLFKGLTFGRFIVSTALTILSYGALTNYRQKHREEKIKKEFFARYAQEQVQKSQKLDINAFGDNSKKKGSDVSFKGSKFIYNLMFSPVNNTMCVDAAISSERLAKAQNKQEFLSFAFKEGSFWFFMYGLNKVLKKGFDSYSLKHFNLPIDLDARAIESEELKSALLNNKIMEQLYEFPAQNNPSNAEIYQFVNENQENLIVKMAKKSGIVETIKNTDSIDTRKFIDSGDIVGLKDKLKMLSEKAEEFVKNSAQKLGKNVAEITSEEKSEMLSQFLKKVKSANRLATILNITSCIGFLGVFVPATIVAWRFASKDNKEFQVKKDIEAKLLSELNSGKVNA